MQTNEYEFSLLAFVNSRSLFVRHPPLQKDSQFVEPRVEFAVKSDQLGVHHPVVVINHDLRFVALNFKLVYFDFPPHLMKIDSAAISILGKLLSDYSACSLFILTFWQNQRQVEIRAAFEEGPVGDAAKRPDVILSVVCKRLRDGSEHSRDFFNLVFIHDRVVINELNDVRPELARRSNLIS